MHIIAQSHNGEFILEGIVADDADLDGEFTLKEVNPPGETLLVYGWLFEIEVIPDPQDKPPEVTVLSLLDEIRQAGYTPSGGAWENSTTIHVFSQERAGPETFGASLYSITYDKQTGQKHVCGRPRQTAAR